MAILLLLAYKLLLQICCFYSCVQTSVCRLGKAKLTWEITTNISFGELVCFIWEWTSIWIDSSKKFWVFLLKHHWFIPTFGFVVLLFIVTCLHRSLHIWCEIFEALNLLHFDIIYVPLIFLMVTWLSSNASGPVDWNLAPIFLCSYFMVNTLVLPQIIVGKVVPILLKNWRKGFGGMRYIESFYSDLSSLFAPFCGIRLNFVNYFSVVGTIGRRISLLLLLFAYWYRSSTFVEVSWSPLFLTTNHTCDCFWVALVQAYFLKFPS